MEEDNYLLKTKDSRAESRIENLELKNNFKHQEEDVGDESLKEGNNMMQFIAGITASLSVAVLSANIVWNSPGIPHLKSNASDFPVTDTQGGWIISIYHFSDIIGSLLNILLIDRIGRKFSLLLTGIPALIAWILIINAKNYIYVLIAKFIAGIGQGFTYNTVVIYLAEIAEKDIRGSLVAIMRTIQALFHFGLTAVGTFFPYQILNYTCIFIPILFLSTFSFMPESPYFFLLQGRDDDALKSLMRLRGHSNSLVLKKVVREMKLDIEEKERYKTNSVRELFLRNYNRKCMFIVICMKLTQVMAGHSAILNYTQEIFYHSGSSIPPKISVLILSGIVLVSTLAAGVIMDRISKRITFLVSGILSGVFLGAVGIFFFLKFSAKVDVTSITWLPLSSLILYAIVYYLGIAIIPYILQGELFAMNVKGAAVAFGMIIGSCFSFTSNTGYNYISIHAGVYIAFWFYSIVAIIGSVLTFRITPESNRKTLEEIHAMENPEMKRKLELERIGQQQ
ncbi:facilitated trehalose transporter Tret1-like [Leptopilina heterotoma]|uniref:facilitated trehalose transporter Tret1-like n=1 Tax=Leptopilina heterotoma TaxID=63436 RepID=UPI001CA80623|nr:facilitated trehalose transporter Tret1-like [Leptopilina heterotoma]XP_043474722.1 facilitated trehalose transporter Tret1-like [Leptopilina heterotoma]